MEFLLRYDIWQKLISYVLFVMQHINDLPEEILALILNRTYSPITRRVCKRWSDIILPPSKGEIINMMYDAVVTGNASSVEWMMGDYPENLRMIVSTTMISILLNLMEAAIYNAS